MRGAFPLMLGCLPVLALLDTLRVAKLALPLTLVEHGLIWVGLALLTALVGRAHGHRESLVGAGLFLVVGAALPLAPWGSWKRVERTLAALEVGAERARVEQLLEGAGMRRVGDTWDASEDFEGWASPYVALPLLGTPATISCRVAFGTDQRLERVEADWID